MTLRIKLIAATCCFVAGFPSLSQAQEMNANTLVQPAIATTRGTLSDNDTENSLAENTAIKTLFSMLFPLATAPQWSQNGANNFVSFLNNGRKASACFSPKGKLNYTITACDADQLPKDFRKKISKSYKSYHLFHATQITAYGETAYQAIMENTTGFITLKYTSEGVEEIQQVKK